MTNRNDLINSVVQTRINSYGDERMECTDGGLTKREYFAAMAMQGMLSDTTAQYSEIPFYAVKMADELIEQLNKSNETN